jgi:hypothetical protein
MPIIVTPAVDWDASWLDLLNQFALRPPEIVDRGVLSITPPPKGRLVFPKDFSKAVRYWNGEE